MLKYDGSVDNPIQRKIGASDVEWRKPARYILFYPIGDYSIIN